VMDHVLQIDSLLSTIDRTQKSSPRPPERDYRRLDHARRKLLSVNAMFEWRDGPLISAMRAGDVFLLDEISLADDSVLERLNSVLEPNRTMVLAERGGDDVENQCISAAAGFKLVATMNPGGDYGKKELSPALRNRFTEIWVPQVQDRRDMELIIDGLWTDQCFEPYTRHLLDFVLWFCGVVRDNSICGLRDIIVRCTIFTLLPRHVHQCLGLGQFLEFCLHV
jgi:midasin